MQCSGVQQGGAFRCLRTHLLGRAHVRARQSVWQSVWRTRDPYVRVNNSPLCVAVPWWVLPWCGLVFWYTGVRVRVCVCACVCVCVCVCVRGRGQRKRPRINRARGNERCPHRIMLQARFGAQNSVESPARTARSETVCVDLGGGGKATVKPQQELGQRCQTRHSLRSAYMYRGLFLQSACAVLVRPH